MSRAAEMLRMKPLSDDVSIKQHPRGAQSPPAPPTPALQREFKIPSQIHHPEAEINCKISVHLLLYPCPLAQVCVEHRPVGGLRSLLAAMKELNTKSSVGSNCEVWKFLVRQINWI